MLDIDRMIAAENDRKREEETRKQLGEPNLVVGSPREHHEMEHTGYWWVAGGIVSYTCNSKGAQWDLYTRKEYPDDVLSALNNLISKGDPHIEPKEDLTRIT